MVENHDIRWEDCQDVDGWFIRGWFQEKRTVGNFCFVISQLWHAQTKMMSHTIPQTKETGSLTDQTHSSSSGSIGSIHPAAPNIGVGWNETKKHFSNFEPGRVDDDAMYWNDSFFFSFICFFLAFAFIIKLGCHTECSREGWAWYANSTMRNERVRFYADGESSHRLGNC